jgi:hypothetical protein
VPDPVRSPCLRVSASGTGWKAAFATGVLPEIIAFRRSTGNSAFPSRPRAVRYRGSPRVRPVAFTLDGYHRLHALYAQLNRVTLALHVLPPLLARSSLGLFYRVPSDVFPGKRGLQSEDLHPPRGVAGSGFRLLPTIPHCCLLGGGCPPRGSSGRVAVPLWLDVLSDQLPVIGLVGHYLTNCLMGREPLSERHDQKWFSTRSMRFACVCGITHPFGVAIPHSEAGYSRVTQPSATSSANTAPTSFDLHVLGTPPAFTLSQDQARSVW